jgi:hypothetical protein
VAPRYRSLGIKIGTPSSTVNRSVCEAFVQLPTLIVALASLILWGVLVFVMGPQPGVIHLLLALGTTLLVRWWALRA